MKILFRNLYDFLLKPKKIFRLPKKSKLLIYDRVGSELFLEYIENKDVEILDLRGESLNLIVLLKSFFFKRFTFRGYINTYIETVQPKVVLTFIDNNFGFYKVKSSHKSVKTVFVQNGVRGGGADIFDKIDHLIASYQDVCVDYILVHNDHIGKMYQKYLKSEFLSIGSFKCNHFFSKKLSNQENPKLVFISQYRQKNKNADVFYTTQAGLEIKYSDFYESERILLPLLKKFCELHGLELCICAASSGIDEGEYHFFTDILGESGWSIQYKKNTFSSYEVISDATLVVTIDSTLGYESFAVGKKTCFFSTREELASEKDMSFCWSSGFPKKGNFWTDELSHAEFDRIMNFVFTSDQNTWENNLNELRKNVIEYDPGNKKFIELMQKLEVLI